MKPAGFGNVLGLDTTLFSMFLLLGIASACLLRTRYYPVHRLFPLIPFVAVVIIAIARSDSGEYQAAKTQDFLFLTCVIVIMMPSLFAGRKSWYGLSVVWIVASLTASVSTFLVEPSEQLYGRSGIGLNTLGPANVIALGSLATITLWMKGTLTWMLALPLAAVQLLSLLSIGSRGPVIGVAAGLLFWLLLSFQISKRRIAYLGMLSMMLFLVAQYLPSYSRARLVDLRDGVRTVLLQEGISRFLNDPLLGVGWGNFASSGLGSWPHNLFIEIAAELGLLGLATFAVLLLTLARRIIRFRKVAEVNTAIPIAICAFVSQQVSSDLTNRIFWMAVIPVLLLEEHRFWSNDAEATTRRLSERPVTGAISSDF